MKLTLQSINNTLSGFFSILFSSAAKKAATHNKLSRHIVALNKKNAIVCITVGQRSTKY